MKIVIVGGTGLIGQPLVGLLRIAPTRFDHWLSTQTQEQTA